jgi:hypothetical protein
MQAIKAGLDEATSRLAEAEAQVIELKSSFEAVSRL